MMTNTLSFIARVGAVAYLLYFAWSPVSALWNKALTGQPTLQEWMYVIFSVLFCLAIALTMAVLALLLLFCLLNEVRNALTYHLKIILRDAAALRCGR